MRKFAKEANIHSSGDEELETLDKTVHGAIMPFATSEWLESAPLFVDGVENLLQSLRPGVSLGEAYPQIGFSRPHEAPSLSASSSQSSITSSVLPPPVSRTPSTDSDVPHASQQESDSGGVARPTRPLPKSGHSWSGGRPPPSTQVKAHQKIAPSTSSSNAGVVHPSSLAATVVPPVVPSRIEDPPITPATATSATSSGRPSRKRSSTVLAPAPRPAGWVSCSFCKEKRKRCGPPRGVQPPFTSCTTCLIEEVSCDLGAPGA